MTLRIDMSSHHRQGAKSYPLYARYQCSARVTAYDSSPPAWVGVGATLSSNSLGPTMG